MWQIAALYWLKTVEVNMSLVPKNPFISLNKLAEYVSASPVRQKAIVQMMKYGKGVSQYRDAHYHAAQFLSSGQNPALLDAAITNLIGLNSLTYNVYRERSINALQVFKGMCPINFGTPTYHSVPLNAHSGLDVEGVYVSVRPDILFTYTTSKGVEMGAGKVYFPAGNSLGNDGGECVSTILYHYLTLLSPSIGMPKPKHCFSIDVHRHNVCFAPRTHVRMMNNVREACKNYLLKWNSI
jgi:hypothetical protein